MPLRAAGLRGLQRRLLLRLGVALLLTGSCTRWPSPTAFSRSMPSAPAVPASTPARLPPPPALPAVPVPTAPEPTVTYIVGSDDTLEDIALGFNTTLEAILAVNPGLNPDLPLTPGVVLVVPGGDRSLPTVNSPIWPFTAQISSGGALNLRTGPGLNEEVIVTLDPLTPLTVVGRSLDGLWLEVHTAYQTRGWVYARYTDVFIDLQQVPVVYDAGVSPVVGGTGTPAAISGATPNAATSAGILTGLTEHAHEIFRDGLALGNRPNVFSKVGDSITVSPAFLTAVGQGRYNLGGFGYLQDVIDYYSGEWARTHNSFDNDSLAAQGGWWASRVITNGYGDPDYCRADETPLECEYRWVRPSVALILLGTNDVPTSSPEHYSNAMRRVIEISIADGVIPVVSTIPPMDREGASERVDLINAEITRLAREYEIPLWDYHAALMALPNSGLSNDGVHPSWAPRDHTGDFSTEYLQYGMTVRSLTALQVLDEIWRAVIVPELPPD